MKLTFSDVEDHFVAICDETYIDPVLGALRFIDTFAEEPDKRRLSEQAIGFRRQKGGRDDG